MQISADSEPVWGRRRVQDRQRWAGGICNLPAISLETDWMRSEPRGVESLRTSLAAGQATSEKTQLPCQEMSPHRGGNNKKREESPLGRGLPALLCLWGCFWFPASNCGLGMVGNLIKRCQGLAEVAWEPVAYSSYPVTASSMSYIERNCVSVDGEDRGGGL